MVLSSYTKLAIPHLDWALVVKIDLDEVLVPIYELRTLLSILAVVVISLVSIFGWFAARGFSQPMVRLTEHANNIAGKLDNQIEISGQDEVAVVNSTTEYSKQHKRCCSIGHRFVCW